MDRMFDANRRIVGSKEYDFYEDIKKEYGIGNGEAAAIALTYQNGGVIASNNLGDVYNPIKKYDLNLITTAFILAIAYENQIKSKDELDDICLVLKTLKSTIFPCQQLQS